ncbi:MAG: Sua5/YciO/YrdC/YwlC family protein, partial [Planctomycetes bacterium]|nr:Sua5/YciO/YrdC/YwlC family protein [Planctomycetota bacterium]
MKARVVPARLDAAGLAAIEEAAKAIATGALVAFPTETVYGIACNSADAAALERLKAVKGRPPDKPFSLHVGRKEDVARHVANVPPAARKLMSRYWPGPLTIVFPT